MFGWKQVLDTQDQHLCSKNKDELVSAGIDVKIKYKYGTAGGLSVGRVQYGNSGVRSNVTYRLLVKKQDSLRARSLIFNR